MNVMVTKLIHISLKSKDNNNNIQLKNSFEFVSTSYPTKLDNINDYMLNML